MEEKIIKYLPLVLTVCSTLAAGLGFIVARVRKNYGLERDINHLKRDYQSLAKSSDVLFTELERRLDTAERQLAVLQGINQTLIAQRMGTTKYEHFD